MDFDISSFDYKSRTQLVRAASEDWFSRKMYCPNCLSGLKRAPANSKTLDFSCSLCDHAFELKSHARRIPGTVPDGAYETMISSIESALAPDFFFLSYDPESWNVTDLIVVPRFFLSRSSIRKRPPLKKTARRAGWVGCDILVRQIPDAGRISMIHEGEYLEPKKVMKDFRSADFLDKKNEKAKGWFSDVLLCIQSYKCNFTLSEFYLDHADKLQELHPENRHIRDKIRQQLQILRDRGFIRFLGRGNYSRY
jgi:type II restriction enzyme